MATKYFEAKAVRFCAARDALLFALNCIEFKAQDELLVSVALRSDISDFLKANCVKLVLSDVCEAEFVCGCEDMLSKITEKTKAVVISHRFGRFTEPKILAELKKRNITLIEECVGCIGSVYFSNNGLLRPGACDISCMIESDFALVAFQNTELLKKFPVSDSSYCEKFLELLPNIETLAGNRRQIALRYRLSAYEKGLPLDILPLDNKNCFCSMPVYPIRTKARDELAAYLKAFGMPCTAAVFAFEDSALPQFEVWKKQLLLLSTDKSLTFAEQKKIIEKIGSFYADKID